MLGYNDDNNDILASSGLFFLHSVTHYENIFLHKTIQ